MTDRKTASTINDTELDQLYNQLDRVRALRDDLHGITGARYIADALDTILDQPTPAATPAAD